MRSNDRRERGSIAGRGRCDPRFHLVAGSGRDDRHITWMHGERQVIQQARGVASPTLNRSK
jgi:hypothetical protein